MAPRLNKRQQREEQDLLALSVPSGVDGELEASDTDESESRPAVASTFSALMVAKSEDDSSGEDESVRNVKPKKPKKKKKKKAVAPAHASTEPTSATPTIDTPQQGAASPADATTKHARKALKKANAKEKKRDVDELEQALAELSTKYPELQAVASATATGSAHVSVPARSSTLATLLAVTPAHLDSDAEMRRFFGAKVVSAARASAAGTGSGGAARAARQAGVHRSQLARPKPGWWPPQTREGLTLRALAPDEVSERAARHGWSNTDVVEERWWTVEYSKKYKSVTMAFMQTVMSGDPENFWRLLRMLQWHADTLLQLAEGYRYREEHSSAMDFVERALFAYERAFVGAFTFTSGTNRLDFDRAENRPFFLALHRQIVDLQRRGCFRTAFEFARLLYALDPWTDPHGALLHLDFLALKAGMVPWLLEVWDYFSAHAKEPEKGESAFRGRMNVTALPGWAYARALAMYGTEDENHEASTTALRDAIMQFPTVVPILADKADISLSSDVRGHRAFRIHTEPSFLSSQPESILHLLSHLYGQRSASLWKPPRIASWLSSTVASTITSLPPSPSTSNTLFTALFRAPAHTFAVYRHVSVLESSHRNLLAFLPRDLVAGAQFAGDPVPPPTRVSTYDAEFFRGTEDVFAYIPRSRRDEARMLERLVPDPIFRAQLQGFFAAHPNFAERFPGGINQFVQVAGQMDEGLLEALMIGAADAEGAQQGAAAGVMPGMFPEFAGDFRDGANTDDGEDARDLPPGQDVGDDVWGEEDQDEDEDEDEEEAEVAPMPVRLLRTFVNRFWGGGESNENEESSEEEDEKPRY